LGFERRPSYSSSRRSIRKPPSGRTSPCATERQRRGEGKEEDQTDSGCARELKATISSLRSSISYAWPTGSPQGRALVVSAGPPVCRAMPWLELANLLWVFALSEDAP
jgi:hypothetical protein